MAEDAEWVRRVLDATRRAQERVHDVPDPDEPGTRELRLDLERFAAELEERLALLDENG